MVGRTGLRGFCLGGGGGSYTCPITVSFEDCFILVLPPLVATACIFLITVAVRR